MFNWEDTLTDSQELIFTTIHLDRYIHFDKFEKSSIILRNKFSHNDFYTGIFTRTTLPKKYFLANILGGDYMIPVCWDEILTHPTGTDFPLRLHGFHPDKPRQFSTWYLIRFVYIFF